MKTTEDEIKRIAKLLAKGSIERKACILLPTFNGFDVYTISESLAKYVLHMKALNIPTEDLKIGTAYRMATNKTEDA